MLETIREFGLERLTATGEEATVGRRHAAYYLDLAKRAEAHFAALHNEAPWIDRLQGELGNLRTALAWFERAGDVEASLRLGAALTWFWHSRGHVTEGRGWLERSLLRSADVTGSIRAKALIRAGHLALFHGDYDQAAALAEAGLVLWRTLDDRNALADSLLLHGISIYQRTDRRQRETVTEQATMLIEESLALWRQLGNKAEQAMTLIFLGTVYQDIGRYAPAKACYDEALALADAAESRLATAMALSWLGYLSRPREPRTGRNVVVGESFGVVGERVAHRHRRMPGRTGGDCRGRQPARGCGPSVRSGGSRRRSVRRTWPPGMDHSRVVGDHRGGCSRPSRRRRIRDRMGRGPDHAACGSRRGSAGGPQGRRADAGRTMPPRRGLTPREWEVLVLLVEGHSDRAIAAQLFVGRRTVASHVTSILAKLGVETRTAAATHAVRHGLV